MNWKLFLAACILSGGVLLKYGAPLPAVIMGIALAAFFTWRRQRG
jgi:hypothetical protein